MKKSVRKALILAAKLAVAAGLLGWVLSKVHWEDYVVTKAGGESLAVVGQPHPDWNSPQTLTVSRGMWWWKTVEADRPAADFEPMAQTGSIRRLGLRATLAEANALLLAIALAGYLVSLAIVGIRWWFLLGIQEIRIRLWEALRLTYLGQFFNTVVPGTVGGDLVKAYYAAKHTPRKAGVLVSIFVDRVLGFAEMVLLAAVMLTAVWLGGTPMDQIRQAGFFVLTFMAGISVALTFLLSPGLRRLLHLQKIYQRLPISHHIAAAGDAANLYRRRLGGLAKAVLMTVGAQVMWICAIGLIGTSLKLPVPFYSYLVYVPVIYMCASFIPVPGGVGVIEGAYVLFFSATGCDASQILALALMARVMDIARGLPGLWVVITGPRLPKSGAMQAELKADAETPR